MKILNPAFAGTSFERNYKMKKIMIFAIFAAAVAVSSYFVFAKESASAKATPDKQSGKTKIKEAVSPNLPQDANKQKETMNKQCCGKMTAICPIHLMTAQTLMQRQIVTPTDGGVIILVGNKLLKYDKDLNFLKETELNIDMEQTQKEIVKMIETCPMCQRMEKQ
jgi:hypothetical protein